MMEDTPLHLAVFNNDINTAELLINLEADVNLGSSAGLTALHLAVEKNNPNIVKILIKSGADIDQKDKLGRTPLYLTVVDNNICMATRLISYRANVDIKDNDGYTALYIAIVKNNVDIIKLLINMRADVNVKNYEKITPLHIAVMDNRLNITILLVKAGSDINAKDHSDNTPLSYAEIKKNRKIIEFLKLDNTEVSIPSLITIKDVNEVHNYKLQDKCKALCAIIAFTSPFTIGAICCFLLGMQEAALFISAMTTVVLMFCILMVCFGDKEKAFYINKNSSMESANIATQINVDNQVQHNSILEMNELKNTRKTRNFNIVPSSELMPILSTPT
ncbi:ankyrin repeat domain-containing protein [Candidatus Mesenet endosymbiont of Agriotes lineatus]|uniref:ankyrin repeat domain-containing protein n=1 Tax=Candidatus Mesenet endosymbiont of Agriotes lineatus TaxID=3077948 RepID=UPI0030D185F9